MKVYYKNKIKEIESQLKDFYNVVFLNEEEEFKANQQNKNVLRDFILELCEDKTVSEKERQSIIDKALYLLSKNTGSMEDTIIAENILDELFYQRQVINQQDIDNYYNNASTGRW
jgi:tRNA U34 5-carboxymethylaminomethyl modifying GTPase MnmE/TrmE